MTSALTRRALATAVAIAAAFAAGHATLADARGLPRASATLQPGTDLVGADGMANIIIVLQGEPAVAAYARALSAAGGTGPLAATAAGSESRRTRDQLRSAQDGFVTRLAATGVKYSELYRVQRALNAIAVRMAPADMAKVRALPGVARVEYLPQETITTSSSVPFINAPEVWEGTPLGTTAAKGEGIRIGIIDTGVDYQHPDFGGSGLLADYQANDRTTIADTIGGNPIFPTVRVVGGYDFSGDAYTGGNTPAPDPDPMDCNGHGTHVAGIAAGGGVKADGTAYTGPWDSVTDYSGLRIGPGVAPKADIYALRVFGCGGSTGLTTQAIDWATDPNDDGDLSDRLDVINMSLGSNNGLSFDATAASADNATLTGMVVVASAGNAGDTFFISGSPGVGTSVISTASSLDSGLPGPLLVNAPAAIAGYKSIGSASFGVAPPPGGLTSDVVWADDNDTTTGGAGTIHDGCQAFVNAAAVAGKIALVDRGLCGFKLKAYNAQLAGAAGVIIANVATSGSPGTAPGMADDPLVPAITIPVVSLNLADGDAIRTNIGAPVNVTMNQGADTASSFTSRGPRGGDGSIALKPDLTAPGSSITSAQTGITCTGSGAGQTGCLTSNASGYRAGGLPLVLSGTSMASPHAAGMMALLRQLNPISSAEELKAMAMNTAASDVSLLPNGTAPLFGAARVGAGRVHADLAATAKVLAYNDDVPGAVSVTFDDDVVGPTTRTHKVRLQNHTAVIQNVTLSLDTLVDSPGVDFAITSPTSVSLAAGGSAVVTVQMTADPSLMVRSLESTMSPVQATPAPFNSLGNLPRHYMAQESALLKVSKDATELARLPVYMAHHPHSDMQAEIPASTPTSGTVNLALTGTGVCTGSLSGGVCTADTTVDNASTVSPFELQVVGTEDPNLPPFANIRYAGISYDPGFDEYYFGIATFGSWSTGAHGAFNICIDNNSDGTYDKVVFNTDFGTANARVFGGTSSGTDVYASFVFTPPGSVSVEDLVNGVDAGNLNTALHDSNVMSIGVLGSDIGVTPGTPFRYAVATCPWFNPLCVRLTNPTQCSSAGAYSAIPGPFAYNSATPGIAASGGFGGLVLHFDDQNGGTLPIDYNEANMTANGSQGLLLLHQLNRPGNAAQVVPMDIIYRDGFGTNTN